MRQFGAMMVLTGLMVFSHVVLADASSAGDPSARAGQIVTQVCAACHGADGNSTSGMYPKLAGQHAAYIYHQLTDFKSGRRKSPIMNGIASTLSDADMHALADYFSSQSIKPGTGKDPVLVAQGEQIYRAGDKGTGVPACMACHGPTGEGIPTEFPRIGEQHAEYIVSQLKAFSTGERANDPNKMMRDIASRMTDAQMQAVSQYIAGLH
ncbi:MAG TPA: c-type cytochrome [Burkholderiales bacterium]|nr:c-type cytochrome [Burkholderiales bacterium]